MYDNISAEQSDESPGRILKTSPDLSTMAVIANARQGERISLFMSHRTENGPGDSGDWRDQKRQEVRIFKKGKQQSSPGL